MRIGVKRLLQRAIWIGLALWAVTAPAGPGALAGEWVAVKRVNDGDTVELKDGRLVRYIGVDAPEINHERHTAEPFGFEARRENAELIRSGRLRIEFDVERFDPYGRTLAYVFLPDGSMVNTLLVKAGLAMCYHKLPNVKYSGQLLVAQREAMTGRRGIWQAEQQRQSSGVLANRNSRRFHTLSCPEAKRISPQNRIRFESRWEAFWQGYSPSRECHPAISGR
jgi:micrococcal nuclease